MAARVRIGIAMTSNDSIGKRESVLPHRHRRAHLEDRRSWVNVTRSALTALQVAHGQRGCLALSTVFIAP